MNSTNVISLSGRLPSEDERLPESFLLAQEWVKACCANCVKRGDIDFVNKTISCLRWKFQGVSMKFLEVCDNYDSDSELRKSSF